jgi:UDP-glucose 4-epimerase
MVNKILVTGHKGYIGSHLYTNLREMGHDVRGIDLKDGNDIKHSLPNSDFDYVFHMAALPSVQYSVENPSYTMLQNVYATSVLLQWAKEHGVKRVIFSSSAAAIGENGHQTSPYGMHKKISEMECKLYSQLYGIDTVCLRYFNVYSEYQEYGGAYSTVIAAWMHMISIDKPLRIDGDGEQTRDFIHVDDIVSANIFCMNYENDFNGDILNIASGESVSLKYIKSFIDSKNKDIKWNIMPDREGDIKHSMSDIKKILDLGWSPNISISDGLEKCFGELA